MTPSPLRSRSLVWPSLVATAALLGFGLSYGCAPATGSSDNNGSGGHNSSSGSGGHNNNSGSGGNNNNSGTGGNNNNQGTGGNNNNQGSGGHNNNSGTGGNNNSGTGGNNNSGSGGRNGSGTGGNNGSGTGGNNGSGTGGNNGSGTGGNNGGGTGGFTGATPAGYWTSGSWHGCAWTGVDTVTVAPNKTTIMPMDFTGQAAGGPFHVKGTVGPDPMYNGVALLGFNLDQDAAGANCTYDPTSAMSMGPPGVALDMSKMGIAVNFSKTGAAFTLRVQIQGPNGATDANDRWCYTLTQTQGKDFAPFSHFYTQCWNDTTSSTMSKGNLYNGEPISAIVFTVPGGLTATPYEFTVNGFAMGNSAADAPDGGTSGSLTGTIGGPGSTDLDFQRVKVSAGGHSYIIQNNNWGNPSGTDQTIMYKDNSFNITSITGGDLGQGMVRSFPSIYIGANGNTMAGALDTSSDDMLPKQISAIQHVNTTFTINKTGGNYNATYDVWFANAKPTAQYSDAISGFLMVWLYKPSQNNPIGGSPSRTATVGGKTWNVYSGPRGGTNPNRPVVSYVAPSPLTTLTFDLNDFIKDAVANNTKDSNGGIQSSWWLTDVFAGFEIWSGSDAQGLAVNTFTAVVQ